MEVVSAEIQWATTPITDENGPALGIEGRAVVSRKH
jgi:hypothetical protein